MKILLLGASGDAGSRIAAEARFRGHEITAASRGHRPFAPDLPASRTLVIDASDPGQVARAAGTHDLVIAATRPAVGREEDVEAMTAGTAEGVRRTGHRLLVVGGAAPLRVPGAGRRALDDPEWVPPEIRSIAASSCRQLEILRAADGLEWTCLAPPALFAPGPRTGAYRFGGDELVIDDQGRSALSMEDFAIAVLDEAERPTVRRGLLSIGR